jgi:hypothetical protein
VYRVILNFQYWLRITILKIRNSTLLAFVFSMVFVSTLTFLAKITIIEYIIKKLNINFLCMNIVAYVSALYLISIIGVSLMFMYAKKVKTE